MNRSNRKRREMMMACFKRFFLHRAGVALIEFAIVFPVFFLLLFGGIEISRLILIQQKLEKAGYVMADIVTQYAPAENPLLAGQINLPAMNGDVFPQLDRMMTPYNIPANQSAIITSLRIAAGGPTIDWQVAGGGGLTAGTCDGLTPNTCAVSLVNGLAPAAVSPAVRGTVPAFPTPEGAAALARINALPIIPGGAAYSVIVNEVFYFYQPLLQPLLQNVGAAGGTGFAGFNFFLRPKIYVKRTYFVPRRTTQLYNLPPTFPVP